MVRDSISFKRIVLFARKHHAHRTVLSCMKKLVNHFNTLNIPILLEVTSSLHYKLNTPIIEQHELNKNTDILVVVGGDGSLLSAASLASEVGIRIIGINRGYLGFLTDMTPKTMLAELEDVLKGQFQEEQRHLLRVRLFDDKTMLMESRALNDLVLGRGKSPYLVEFSVLIDNQFVSHYRADGLILSTPTGSTAYNLSAGGPILHPQLQAFALVPMFSHSLNARPLVISNDSSVQIKISTENLAPLAIYLDGHQAHLAQSGQYLLIDKHPQLLHLLHPNNYLYYDTLRIKLGWGSKE